MVLFGKAFVLTSCHFNSDTLSVPAYSLGGLSDDESGVFGVMHTLVGEGDWMVHTGLLQSCSRRARQTVGLAHKQTLVQTHKQLSLTEEVTRYFCVNIQSLERE